MTSKNPIISKQDKKRNTTLKNSVCMTKTKSSFTLLRRKKPSQISIPMTKNKGNFTHKPSEFYHINLDINKMSSVL